MALTRAERYNASLPMSDELRFDACHVAANRRCAEGAWHDAFAIGKRRFVISIGNVAGSRAESVALMSAVRQTFEPETSPSESATLLRAADAIFRRHPAAGEPFASAIVGIIDCTDQTFTYVSAGHPPPFIRYHDGTVAALPADGLPIGLSAFDHPPATFVVSLRDAELLVLYSNVLVQTTKDVGDGLRRLQGVLADERMARCERPAMWLAQRMLGDRAHDDVALLATTFMRARSSSSANEDSAGERPRWSVSWSFDATGATSTGARRAFLACLTSKENGGRAIDLAVAELIFGELLGNVVRHAPGSVEITLDWSGALPVLHVLDNGPGFRSRRARERLPADDLSESGRGLFIINACATAFSVRNRKERGTHAIATLALA